MSQPTATLRLRGSSGPVEAQIHFPPKNPSGRLVVAFVDSSIAEKLCSTLAAVVIAMSPAAANMQPLLEWIAAHAAELGASADAIAVTGIGDSATRAREMVAAAARSGWPPLQLLNVETALATPHTTSIPTSVRDRRKQR